MTRRKREIVGTPITLRQGARVTEGQPRGLRVVSS
jgi:hypothetical protein